MEGAGPLTLLSIVMFIGSFLSGCIPLAISMSETKLQNVSIFGAGLLVGTALSVIIPEGVKSLYMVVNASNISGATTIAAKIDMSENLPSRIGITLLLGFILMLLIDQCFSRHHSKVVSQRTPDITATLGLVVHAAVDGVALGAAATTSEADVEMIVFLAIMLHKAPAAFALVTFLMHEGVDRRHIRHHLLVFSSAAPLFALLTFFGISQESKETLTTLKATGTAMLFSAGTFLYVATVHVLPELTTSSGGSLKPHQVIYLVIGTLAPLLLTLFH